MPSALAEAAPRRTSPPHRGRTYAATTIREPFRIYYGDGGGVLRTTTFCACGQLRITCAMRSRPNMGTCTAGAAV